MFYSTGFTRVDFNSMVLVNTASRVSSHARVWKVSPKVPLPCFWWRQRHSVLAIKYNIPKLVDCGMFLRKLFAAMTSLSDMAVFKNCIVFARNAQNKTLFRRICHKDDKRVTFPICLFNESRMPRVLRLVVRLNFTEICVSFSRLPGNWIWRRQRVSLSRYRHQWVGAKVAFNLTRGRN